MIEVAIEIIIGATVAVTSIITVIGSAFYFIYRKGKTDAIDETCAIKIEKDVGDLRKQMGEHKTTSGEAKKTLHKRIDDVQVDLTQVKIDIATIKGSQETIKELLNNKL